MRSPDLEIVVLGVPGPQGSKSFKGMSKAGRAILAESSKKVAPWRDSVAWAAREAMAGRPPIDGPVRCQMVFVFPRPKSRKCTALHDRKPDLSKLIRSTEDALTTGGAWADDARVVEYVETGKVYAGATGLGINSGAVVRIWKA